MFIECVVVAVEAQGKSIIIANHQDNVSAFDALISAFAWFFTAVEHELTSSLAISTLYAFAQQKSRQRADGLLNMQFQILKKDSTYDPKQGDTLPVFKCSNCKKAITGVKIRDNIYAPEEISNNTETTHGRPVYGNAGRGRQW